MKLPLIVVVLVAAAGAGNAAAVDLHEYWDRNCANCHGHAAAFARRFLAVKDGKLLGRHHIDNLDVFLGNHYLARDLRPGHSHACGSSDDRAALPQRVWPLPCERGGVSA